MKKIRIKTNVRATVTETWELEVDDDVDPFLLENDAALELMEADDKARLTFLYEEVDEFSEEDRAVIQVLGEVLA